MKSVASIALVASLMLPAAGAVAQPMGEPMMGRGMMGGGMMESATPRRPYVRQNGLPEAYRNLTNPLPATAANIKAGQQLFGAHCAVCHGSSRLGAGPAAGQLNQSPSNLEFAVLTPIASDAYLYWSVAEGGTPVGSAMPPFKGSLEKDDIWRVILYLRSNK